MPKQRKMSGVVRVSIRLAAVILMWLSVVVPGEAQGRSGAQVAALTERLTALLAQLPQAAPQQASQIREQAARLMTEREQEFSTLIALNPAEALRQALPPEAQAAIAAALPLEAHRIERRGIWQGEADYYIEDFASPGGERTGSLTHLQLRAGQETLDLRLAGPAPVGLKSGGWVKAMGLRVGNRVAVERSSAGVNPGIVSGGKAIQALAADAPPSASLASCSTTGAQPVVAILVNFTSTSLPVGVTQDAVRGSLMGNAFAPTSQNTPNWSLHDFWQQNSDGQASVNTGVSTVVGPFNLAGNFNPGGVCDTAGMKAAAIAAADGTVNFQDFNRIMIVHPQNAACSYSGFATVGCEANSSAGDGNFTASTAWLNANFLTSRDLGVQTMTHEAGHNLGLGHADRRDFGPEPLGALTNAGIVGSLGDEFSAMGTAGLGLYSSKHAATELGWLAPTTNFQTVESNGNFTIQNYERRPAGVKALKIRRGAGNDAWVWVEYRQNTGIYDNTLDSQVWTGALIHYQDSTFGTRTELLDYFQPSLDDWTDVALTSGSTWVDPYTGLTITPSNATATTLDVAVSYVNNDNIANAATVVNFQSSFSNQTAAYTTEVGDPTPSCGNSSRSKSAWYRFTPQLTGTAVVDTFTSNYNTLLSAYSGSPGALLQVSCNDDAVSPPQSRISFSVTAGTTYYVMVSAVNNDGGTLVVNFSLPSGTDNFASAIAITTSPFTSTTTTTSFTTEGSDPTPSCGAGAANRRAKSAWYKFTPAFSGTTTIDTHGSNYDTILSIWTGSPGSFVEIGCNDDEDGQFSSRITFQATAGVTYHVMVSAFNNDGGSLQINAVIPLAPPINRRRGQTVSE